MPVFVIHLGVKGSSLAAVNFEPLRSVGQLAYETSRSPYTAHTERRNAFEVTVDNGGGGDINPAQTLVQMGQTIAVKRVTTQTEVTGMANSRSKRLGYIEKMTAGGWTNLKQIDALTAAAAAVPQFSWGGKGLPRTDSTITEAGAALTALQGVNNGLATVIAAAPVAMPEFFVDQSVATNPNLLNSVLTNMAEVRRALANAGVPSKRIVPIITWKHYTPTPATMTNSTFVEHMRALAKAGVREVILWANLDGTATNGTVAQFNAAVLGFGAAMPVPKFQIDRRPLAMNAGLSGPGPDPRNLMRQEHIYKVGFSACYAALRLKLDRGYQRLGGHVWQGCPPPGVEFASACYHVMERERQRELKLAPQWLRDRFEFYTGFRIQNVRSFAIDNLRVPDLGKAEDRQWWQDNWEGWAAAGMMPKVIWLDATSANADTKAGALALHRNYKTAVIAGEAFPVIGVGPAPGFFDLDMQYLDTMPHMILIGTFRDWSSWATAPWAVDPLTTECHVMALPGFLNPLPDATEVADLVQRGFIVGCFAAGDEISAAQDAVIINGQGGITDGT